MPAPPSMVAQLGSGQVGEHMGEDREAIEHISGDLQTLALLDLLENAIDSRPTEDGGQEPDSSVPPPAEWEQWTQMASKALKLWPAANVSIDGDGGFVDRSDQTALHQLYTEICENEEHRQQLAAARKKLSKLMQEETDQHKELQNEIYALRAGANWVVRAADQAAEPLQTSKSEAQSLLQQRLQDAQSFADELAATGREHSEQNKVLVATLEKQRRSTADTRELNSRMGTRLKQQSDSIVTLKARVAVNQKQYETAKKVCNEHSAQLKTLRAVMKATELQNKEREGQLKSKEHDIAQQSERYRISRLEFQREMRRRAWISGRTRTARAFTHRPIH
eukprot:COSAG02_NODE_16388_length_1087_cov_6.079960_1_plen_335_part_10